MIESDDIEESDGDDAYLPLLPGEGVETNTELSFYFIVYQTEYSIVRLFLGYSILIRFRLIICFSPNCRSTTCIRLLLEVTLRDVRNGVMGL